MKQDMDLLVKFGSESLFRVVGKTESYLEFENLEKFMSMGVSEKFMKTFLELIDSKKFCKNFTDYNYIYRLVTDDIAPITAKTILAQVEGLQICRDEYLHICICSPSNEFKMTLDFADKILEALDKPNCNGKTRVNSKVEGSSLFTVDRK